MILEQTSIGKMLDKNSRQEATVLSGVALKALYGNVNTLGGFEREHDQSVTAGKTLTDTSSDGSGFIWRDSAATCIAL